MEEIEFEKNADGTYNITHHFEDPTAIAYFETYKSTVDDLIAFSEKSWTFEGYKDIEKGIKAKKSNHTEEKICCFRILPY